MFTRSRAGFAASLALLAAPLGAQGSAPTAFSATASGVAALPTSMEPAPAAPHQPLNPAPSVAAERGLGVAAPGSGPQSDAWLMGSVVVTATRTPTPPERVSATTRTFDLAAWQASPTATIDSTLRAAPSFGLFRRSDSLTANPTTQGVSLRGLGPSGASRSLVLVDGIPLNDPFGGWINWSKIPRDAVARAEIVPGGGATAWGNAALGGVIQLFLLPPRTEPVVVGRAPAPIAGGSRGTAQFTAVAGDFGTYSGAFAVAHSAGRGVLQVLGEDFATDGFPIVAAERRGPIDVPASSRHRSLMARWRMALGAETVVTATVRGYEEFRGNGTPYQRNQTREKFAALQAAGQPSDRWAWTAALYAQDQSYASTFSAVNAARTGETPASDQFAVPSTAFGASWTGTWQHADGGSTGVGADVRSVHGETREHYLFTGTDYTRFRVAGGSQLDGGVFALLEQPVGSRLRVNAGARVDAWEEMNGHRREGDRGTGAVSRDDRYPTRHGVEFTPSAGAVWTPARAWRLRANAEQAFRRPTLNELYRPFRQGSNVTEANAGLRTERVTSAELGAEWRLWADAAAPASTQGGMHFRGATPTPRLTLGATAFWNDLRDAVSNVTLAHGPGAFPLFGTLPPGGVGRQRLNVDHTRVQGAELSATWRPAGLLSLTASYLYDDAKVRRAVVAPDLVGRRVAEVPRHSAALTATWEAPAKIRVTPRVRWIGWQYDDDENEIRLGEVVVVDIGLARPVAQHLEVFVNIENVGDTRIETARGADGLVNTGTPRFVLGGIRGRW